MTNIFMFSGQGSQYFHMGKPLFDQDATFRQWAVKLDDLARKWIGASVLASMYAPEKNKAEPFARTLMTHPAIFIVEYALAQSLIAGGVEPDGVLGASLGSFAAAAVAGCVSAADALAAAIHQATALEAACAPGAMLAILADPVLFEEVFLCESSELASVNFAKHFVVSSTLEKIVGIETTLRQRNLPCQRLPVTFAFHSRLIDAAEAPFLTFAGSIASQNARLPLACCDQSTMLMRLPPDFFWRVVRKPIRFRETIAMLERRGVNRYIDVGPAGTLATFLKYGLPKESASTAHAILTPYGQDHKNLVSLLPPGRHR